MKLEKFLQVNSFSKYKTGIEKIKDDFIESGYERFLWRETVVEWDDAKRTTRKEIEVESYVSNDLTNRFINQFSDIDSSDVVFIYPESYTPNYFLIQELVKNAKADYIIENLLPEDDTINHLAVFDSNASEKIQLMNHLVYSAVLGENFGGYKLLGIHLCYYLELCADNSLIYTMQVPNDLMHFQGYVTRKDTNPYIIYDTRKNIENLIKKGYFHSEFELYLNLKNTLMPFLQKMYQNSQKYNSESYDWKTAVSVLKGDLIERGIIKSKWKNEQSLFLLVKKIYTDAIYQYRPPWLSPQSLDIYIPKLNIAIEYQGIQHYTSVDFFGGKLSFEHRQTLDERKRNLCREKNIRLIEWNYNIEINNKNLKSMILQYTE